MGEGSPLQVGFMDQACNHIPGPRPSTASIRVREMGWRGPQNPCPQSEGVGSPQGSPGEELMEQVLSPTRLKAVAQVDDLRQVSLLEMCVDTLESSLGNFGLHLPNLRQLKLNGSRLGSVRDLGTSLGHLHVLWLARCGLSDLDGIGSFPALKELYISYNDISDLSPLCLLDSLEVLDLEGNSVEELGQVRYLHLCPQLAMLTLEGNPVCLQPGPGPPCQKSTEYNYRAEVRRLLPQLQVLDEVPAEHTESTSPRLGEDWLLVKEAIKASRLHGLGRPFWRLSPEQPQGPRLGPCPLRGPRAPLAASWRPEDPGSEEDASSLTHGAGPLLCGNPSKGLRERRHQCQNWEPPEQQPLRPGGPVPPSEPQETLRLLGLARLRTWNDLCLGTLPRRHLDSQMEETPNPKSPLGAPNEQEALACLCPPSVTPGPPSDPSATQEEDSHLQQEASKTPAGLLIPSPPSFPPRPGLSTSSWGPADLKFRGRRLRALGSLEPGLGQELRVLGVGTAGPSLQGHSLPKPAPDSVNRPQVSGTCHS